jgi:hypothetical protein
MKDGQIVITLLSIIPCFLIALIGGRYLIPG